MVDEDVALAHRREDVGGLAVLALQDRLGDPGEGTVAQLGEAGDADDVPEVVHAEDAVDLVDLLVADLEGGHEPVAEARLEAAGELEPDHLAEAAAADLVLDRLPDVVGLVGDVVVGVAGDAEEGVAEDLHPREERLQVAGDHLLHGDEADPVRERHEAPQQLLRHLDPGEDLALDRLRVAEHDEQAQREVGDVGEGPAHAEHQRRQGREDLPVEEQIELATIVGGGLLVGDDPDPVLAERGAQLLLEAGRQALPLLDDLLAHRLDLLGGAHPVGATTLDRGLDLVVEAGDADHEELVQVRLVDRAELDPLEQRKLVVLDQLQDAVVEVHPGGLAVEVERGILEIDLGPDLRGRVRGSECGRRGAGSGVALYRGGLFGGGQGRLVGAEAGAIAGSCVLAVDPQIRFSLHDLSS